MASRVGRPPGSKNGRIPEGGYPEVSAEVGAFLAGFIEGEGCFSVSKQSGKPNHGCSMRIAVREDDRGLLAELAAATRLGSLVKTRNRGAAAPQVAWAIQAKSDCKRLVEILDRYPLRGRKSHDYAIWRPAVDWWVGENAQVTRVRRDWAPMLYLKKRLSEVKRYEAGTSPRIDDPPGLNGDWGGFFAGFFTAEGSLGIYAKGRRLWPRAAIRVRADDAPLLEELCNRTAIGRVYGPYPNPPVSPVVSWFAVSADDIHQLVWMLGFNPLKGRKGREFEIWRQAVELVDRNRSPKSAQGRLQRLKVQLEEARAYRAPELRNSGQGDITTL